MIYGELSHPIKSQFMPYHPTRHSPPKLHQICFGSSSQMIDFDTVDGWNHALFDATPTLHRVTINTFNTQVVQNFSHQHAESPKPHRPVASASYSPHLHSWQRRLTPARLMLQWFEPNMMDVTCAERFWGYLSRSSDPAVALGCIDVITRDSHLLAQQHPHENGGFHMMSAQRVLRSEYQKQKCPNQSIPSDAKKGKQLGDHAHYCKHPPKTSVPISM